MTAVALVASVRKRLAYLASDEVPEAKIIGIWKEEVERLNSQLTVIENFLKKSSKINDFSGNSSSCNDLEKEVVQLAYDVEDAVEFVALHHDASTSKKSSSRVRFKSLLKFPTTMSGHKDEFQILRGKMDELLKRCETDTDESGWNAVVNSSSEVVYFPEKTILGMEEDFEKLQFLLLNDDDRYPSSIISICGMGGIGKTTLAKKLFNDPSVIMHFDCRAWANVGNDFQARDIAAAILMNLSSSGNTKKEIEEMETTQLMERMYKAQKGKRCLVVLDDVWSVEAWETIRFAFPLEHGTKILITTRIKDLASRVNGYLHEMKMFSKEQSWELFRIQSGAQDLIDMQSNPELEEIWKKIVEQCRGHPLSINLVCGVLRGKKLEEWVEVLRGLQEYEDPDLYLPRQVLALSYNYLPFELKPCLLYLGHFPRDQVIPVEKLYLLWMAEGLIISTKDQGHERRMDIVEDYLVALVQRNLVTVQKEDFSVPRKFKSCEIHDLIHDFCIYKGKKEGFLEVVNFEQRNVLPLTWRTAIYADMYSKDKFDEFLNISETKHVRSLLFFGTDGMSQWRPTSSRETIDLKELRWVRILDFDRVDFKFRKLPKGIEKLLHLRYLSFRGCYLEELPQSFHNFPFLETLDLRVRASCKMTIPNILRNLSCLRHLYFPLAFQSATDEKLKVDGLKRLEVLENFNAGVCDADDLPQLEKLEILKGTADGNNADLKKMINFINGNGRLLHSSITIKNYDCYSKERLSIVTGLLECKALHALEIEGHLGALPIHIGLGFREIVFDGSEFGEDPMTVLGKLPNLRSLVLCNDAFVGTEMVCTEADFPKLIYLKLANLPSLVQWEVEDGAMPCLSSLTVEKCNKLRELPVYLADIPTLEEVKIGSMSEEFQLQVRMMAEEQRSFGNEMLGITFYD